MKLRPILFQTAMVQAIQAGRKTQTRRTIKNPERLDGLMGYNEEGDWCPYGKVGDVLWVRETWNYRERHEQYYYKADHTDAEPYAHNGWRPSIFMPYEACRLFLEITAVRVERLQDISKEDCMAEGIDGEDVIHGFRDYTAPKKQPWPFTMNAYNSYASLWQKINGRDSWQANPYVWVISFRQIDKPQLIS